MTPQPNTDLQNREVADRLTVAGRRTYRRLRREGWSHRSSMERAVKRK